MTGPADRTPPPIEAVVETAIYAADLGAAGAFYAGVLGLPVIGREAGRHVFFRVGAAGVLLVFNADMTLAGGMLPPHGTRGPGHFALGVPAFVIGVVDREQLAIRGGETERGTSHLQGRAELGPCQPGVLLRRRASQDGRHEAIDGDPRFCQVVRRF